MVDDYEFRGARRNELWRVAEIAQTIAPVQTPPDLEGVKAALRILSQDWHVATHTDNGLVGVAHTEMIGIGRGDQAKEILEIKRLGVDPQYRGQGIGKSLLEHCVKFGEHRLVTEVEVRLAEPTSRTMSFLQSAGFTALMPHVFKRPIDQGFSYEEPVLIGMEADIDVRVPEPLSKKRKFLNDAYPGLELSDKEINRICAYLPEILMLYKEAFHPRTRNRLDIYSEILTRYLNSVLPASQVLENSHFSNPSALHVWLKGFSGSVSRAIKSEDLRIMAESLAAANSEAG
ncbi:MAG TPA: GNAT family N-acetyltransferase [Candidatus Saccharimonadales bacterium]|nr:GNAT family N-acetyltransferase [Candidatus Saccharimonadales bacterium]